MFLKKDGKIRSCIFTAHAVHTRTSVAPARAAARFRHVWQVVQAQGVICGGWRGGAGAGAGGGEEDGGGWRPRQGACGAGQGGRQARREPLVSAAAEEFARGRRRADGRPRLDALCQVAALRELARVRGGEWQGGAARARGATAAGRARAVAGCRRRAPAARAAALALAVRALAGGAVPRAEVATVRRRRRRVCHLSSLRAPLASPARRCASSGSAGCCTSA